jgi:signal transduction histidine kinase/ActR/RegA family two-component response regulator
VWIGPSAGLSRFTPLGKPQHAVTPDALITSIERNDAPVTAAAFDSSTYSVGLRFSILAYRGRETRFRYRLGSEDSPWVYTSGQSVRFAQLPAGGYRFEVQGDTGDEWSRSAVTVFRILAPWYSSWPALIAFAVVLLLCAWLWWHGRQARERAVRAALETAVRERTAELAAATARAEQASRFKGEFLANMSHEMRTPLNGVIGVTELALELSRQPEVAEHLKIVRISAKGLLTVINDILDFSKIESGRMEISPVSFALRPLIEEACAIMQLEAQRKGLALSSAVDPSVPEWVSADDARLRQVLLNLIGNAIKFTAEGSIVVSARYTGGILHFTVTDTGAGIPEEKHSLIFDAFRQVDSSVSRRHGGTGLGLTISRQLVEAMGGTISLESHPAKGSSFSFSVDAPAVEAPPDLPEPAKPAPALPMNILVAEDHKVNQHLIRALLRKRGHRVTIAENGREALEALAREGFDVVLMDIQMPEMDGVEAIRRIRENEQSSGGRIPVIALTARAMTGDREMILAAGMDDYLEKPIQTEKLDASLARFASAVMRA